MLRESGEFGECRIDHIIHIKYVICAKNELSYHACLRRAVLRRLARLADIRQAVLRGLARLAKGEFGKFYANLASLASLANLASVG